MKRFFLFVVWVGLFTGVFVFLCNIVVRAQTNAYIYDDAASAPEAEVALVLGAAIFENGAPTPIFADRIDTAIALYETGKVSKILVSGDNSTVEHNEVNPARLYLIGRGIPDQDIFLDHAGFDTYSTMYRARDIFSVSSVLVTTQSFHLPRAVFIARKLGIDAYGVRADTRPVFLRNYVRETFANVKAVLNLIFERKPKYLGEEIPIIVP